MIAGYVSSKSFYIFLIITIILIFILCISNIVAYANILANDNIEFNHTWAKILIAMNAILIAIAFVIMIILILKFMKGRTGVVAAGAPAGIARTNNTIQELKTLVENTSRNWDRAITGWGGNCNNPYNIGCSGDLTCSDGEQFLPCPGNTGNDAVINRAFDKAVSANLFR